MLIFSELHRRNLTRLLWLYNIVVYSFYHRWWIFAITFIFNNKHKLSGRFNYSIVNLSYYRALASSIQLQPSGSLVLILKRIQFGLPRGIIRRQLRVRSLVIEPARFYGFHFHQVLRAAVVGFGSPKRSLLELGAPGSVQITVWFFV